METTEQIKKLAAEWEGPVHLWLTFYPPSKRHFDDDNVVAAFKPGRDGVADALGIDDSRFVLHPLLSEVVKKGGAVRVTITKEP